MKSRMTHGVLTAAGLVAGVSLALSAGAAEAPVIHAARVSGVKNLADPTGGFWSQAKAVAVAMQPQNTAPP